MSFFEWNDGMSVGAHLIDSDHRALIAIINELHDMLEETDGAVDHVVFLCCVFYSLKLGGVLKNTVVDL